MENGQNVEWVSVSRVQACGSYFVLFGSIGVHMQSWGQVRDSEIWTNVHWRTLLLNTYEPEYNHNYPKSSMVVPLKWPVDHISSIWVWNAFHRKWIPLKWILLKWIPSKIIPVKNDLSMVIRNACNYIQLNPAKIIPVKMIYLWSYVMHLIVFNWHWNNLID